MKPEYKAWITEFVQLNRGSVRGKCAGASAAMVATFQELRLACGLVHTFDGAEQHWWTVTPEGEIVDPTVAQFGEVLEYEELDPDAPETRRRVPSGRCLDCGEYTYGEQFCGEDCERSFRCSLGL